MKVSLVASTAASAAGMALDVVPGWLLLIFVVYVLVCSCVHVTLSAMRDIRDYRAGK